MKRVVLVNGETETGVTLHYMTPKADDGDISIHNEWIEYHIRKCDIILPLVAIATPIEYTRNPLRVFEQPGSGLHFEPLIVHREIWF